MTIEKLPNNILDLWVPATQNWDLNLLSNIFDDQAVKCIANTPVVPSDANDKLRWIPAKKGSCTSKEAFRFLNSDLQDDTMHQGARGISTQALSILTRVWKHKIISPCTKTFIWRLIRRALATGQRAGNLSSKIQKECLICNMTKNDSHLFFHCSFARAV
jgi:hypothetical protein